MHGRKPILISTDAMEGEGINVILEALAEKIAANLEFEVESDIIQTNIVGHTRSDGFGRLARQPFFDGDVIEGPENIIEE